MIPVGDRPVENLIADVLFLQLLLYGIRVVDDRLPQKAVHMVAGEILKVGCLLGLGQGAVKHENGISPVFCTRNDPLEKG